MSTFNLSGPGTTAEKTKPGDTDDYYVTRGHVLDLTNQGTTTVHIGVTAPPPVSDGIYVPGDSDTFDLTGKPGSVTTVYEGLVAPTSGVINLNNATLNIYEWSHTSWNNTGTSVFAHGSTVVTGGVTGGIISVESGSTFESSFNSAHILLGGGTFTQDGVWSTVDNADDVTFEKQSPGEFKQNPSTLVLHDVIGADHWTMTSADMLQIFGADGGVLGSVQHLTNLTGKPLQVDQLAGGGAAIIADATPRPGMIAFVPS